jgi:predicted hydrocarbon binding protein
MTQSPRSQRMEQILASATEEVLGAEGLRSVLEAANEGCSGCLEASSFPTPSRFLQCLEQVYGAPAGRGIALQLGRACFPYGLREYGSTLGLTQTSFRLLPFPNKLKTLSAAFADLFQLCPDERLQIEESKGKLLWHLQDCPLCRERHTTDPVCHLAVGLAQESLYWVSGGKIFQVEETACIARGDLRCTWQIDEVPLS